MQDRFRYRVFDNDDRKMHDVIFLNYENNSVEWYNDNNKKRAAFIEEVPTLQCTGLKDHNNNLIYEGDIVNGHCGVYWMKMLVIWDEISAAFYFKKLDKKGKLLPFVNVPTFVEIIGNRYENPELLEVGILA